MDAFATDLVSEHCSVCSASHDVLFVELLVEGDRLGEPLHNVGYALLEPATPELGFLGLGLGLGRGRR